MGILAIIAALLLHKLPETKGEKTAETIEPSQCRTTVKQSPILQGETNT